MNTSKRPLTYQKVLFSKLVGIPLAVMIGFAGGVICAGQLWLTSGFELVPTEIVLTPPPPNATWCFPDVVFTGAEKFSKELTKQLSITHTTQYSNTVLSRSIEVAIQQDNLGREGYYQLHLLAATPQHFAIIAIPYLGTNPNNYTLITEQGYFYLHTIPERRHEKYDSLASVRLGCRN